MDPVEETEAVLNMWREVNKRWGATLRMTNLCGSSERESNETGEKFDKQHDLGNIETVDSFHNTRRVKMEARKEILQWLSECMKG